MVGVTSPLLRADRRRAARLLAGYASGTAAATLLLLALLTPVARAAQSAAPGWARGGLAAMVVLALAALDLLGRTPHVDRQTPQLLVRLLPSGRAGAAGLAWGFDIGLLFTTIKMSSLLWAALAWAMLLDASALPLVLGVYASVTIALHVTLSLVAGRPTLRARLLEAVGRLPSRPFQLPSGTALAGLGIWLTLATGVAGG
jgi:hypothetical protein